MRKGGKLEGWKVERLGDVVDFMNGLWTGKKPPFINVGVIRNTNFTKDGELDDSNIVYLDVEQSQFAKRKLQYGDIVLEKSGGGPKQPVGRVVIFDKQEGDFSFSNFTSVMRVKDKSQLDFHYLHKYLFHSYLSGTTEKMQSHSTGIRNLKFDEFKQIPVPIPPLPEQQRIVHVLDEAFASIAQAKSNAERNLVNARELFWSVLQSSMSNDDWEKKTLKEISITFGRGKSKNRPRNDPKLYGGKYPFIQTGDIRNSNHYITEYTQTYNEVGLAQSKLWKKGTICITIAANIAETGILGFDACFPDSVIGLVVNPKIADTDFIEYLLQSFRARLQAKGKGSAQDNLNMEKFENEYFPIPPLAEQRAIVGRLEALSAETGRLEEIYQSKVEALEELKKSVLGKAFGGEL